MICAWIDWEEPVVLSTTAVDRGKRNIRQASRRSAVELRSRFTRVIVHTDLHVTVKVTIVAVVTV